MRVLLVEDEPDEARSMQLVLEGEGHEVTLARDGKEALDKAHGAEVVVLDIILPRLNGDVVLKELRKRGSRARVVVVTAVSREVGVEADLRKISRDILFLQKPFSSSDLIAAVSGKSK